VRLVDRDVREVGEQFGASVGGHACLEQFGALVDEARRRLAGLEDRVGKDRFQEGMFVETPRIRNSANALRARALPSGRSGHGR
jgi:hypothetical protein